MSLIYEALRKLEREKRVPGTGFTVVARSTWPERRTTWLPLVLGGVALLVAGLLLGRWLTLPRPTSEATARPAPVPPRANAPDAVAAPIAPRRAPPATLAATPIPAPRVVAPAVVPEATAARPDVLPRREPAPPAAEPAVVDATPAPTVEPLDESPAQPAPLTLEAIAVREGVPVAIISGQLVRAGDRIGDTLVVRIGPDDVELEVAGERLLLGF